MGINRLWNYMLKTNRFWKKFPGLIGIVIILIAMSSSIALAAIINNSVIQIGLNNQGHLIVPGGSMSSNGDTTKSTTYVGLRYMPTNMESIAGGCYCEGWGVGDLTSGVNSTAYRYVIGTKNMSLVSFTSTSSTATSIVNITNKTGTPIFRVTHYYHPNPLTNNLYQVDVSIKNVGTVAVDMKYRRLMDWDIEPTAFWEYVTINTGNAINLTNTTDNGFNSQGSEAPNPNPLSSVANSIVTGATGNFNNSGPADHGALFDFSFGTLAPNAYKNFTIFYGAAATEAEAIVALGKIGAEAYSLAKPSDNSSLNADHITGAPNTFIFAVREIAGSPIVDTSNPGVNITNISSLYNTTLIGLNSTYYLNLTNNGSSADTYTFTISNPEGASIYATDIDTVG
jgi:hypothetical protein